jgi:hypothetical protein
MTSSPRSKRNQHGKPRWGQAAENRGSSGRHLWRLSPRWVLMYFAAMVYHVRGDGPLGDSGAQGAVATAVGLILATSVQLGRKSLSGNRDFLFILLNRRNISLLNAAFGSGLKPGSGFSAPMDASEARRIQFSLDYEV